MKVFTITTTILSMLGATVVFFIVQDFASSAKKAFDQYREISQVHDFKTCRRSPYFYSLNSTFSKGEMKYESCVGYGKEFFAKYSDLTHGGYEYISISKQEFENAKNSTGLASAQSNSQRFESNSTFQKLQKDFESDNKNYEYKTKIKALDTKTTKIDIARHPKPWTLVLGGFGSEDKNNSFKLVDKNLGEILPVSRAQGIDNEMGLKPIYIEKEKTLYYPYRYGKIAALNVETGYLKWSTFDFEIAQMSIFDGKFYLNEYQPVCDTFNTSELVTCNLYEAEIQDSTKKSVILDRIANSEKVAAVDAQNVWLKEPVLDQIYQDYQNGEDNIYTFSTSKFEKVGKNIKREKRVVNDRKPEQYIFFRQTTNEFEVYFEVGPRHFGEEKNPGAYEETVRNCPKNDQSKPCWAEAEKLVAKYRASLEIRDDNFETFWNAFKDNQPGPKQLQCGDLVMKLTTTDASDRWEYDG